METGDYVFAHLFLCLSITGGSSCVTDSGPDNGSPCILPFTLDGATYNECADFSYIHAYDYDNYNNLNNGYNYNNGYYKKNNTPST